MVKWGLNVLKSTSWSYKWCFWPMSSCLKHSGFMCCSSAWGVIRRWALLGGASPEGWGLHRGEGWTKERLSAVCDPASSPANSHWGSQNLLLAGQVLRKAIPSLSWPYLFKYLKHFSKAKLAFIWNECSLYNKYVTHLNANIFIIKACILQLSEFVFHVSIQLYHSFIS